MGDKEHASGTARDGLTIGWPTVTIVLAAVTATSLGTLAVTTSVKNVDTLSTVALALAVLSFAAQLLVTLVQSQQSSKVNADTLSALAEVRATSDSLLTNQQGQFDVVLRAALKQAVPAAVHDVQGESDSGEEQSSERDEDIEIKASDLEKALSIRLNEALREASAPSRTMDRVVSPRSGRIAERKALLTTFPSEAEGRPAAEVLRTLTPRQIAALGRVVSDSVMSPHGDARIQYQRDIPNHTSATASLVQHGLVELLREPPAGKTGTAVYRLSDLGWQAARILRATEEPPAWAADLT